MLDRPGEGRCAASVQDTHIPAIGLHQEEERRAFMLPLQRGRLPLRGFIFLRGLPAAGFYGPSGRYGCEKPLSARQYPEVRLRPGGEGLKIEIAARVSRLLVPRLLEPVCPLSAAPAAPSISSETPLLVRPAGPAPPRNYSERRGSWPGSPGRLLAQLKYSEGEKHGSRSNSCRS